MLICGRLRRRSMRADIDTALTRAEVAASLALARAEHADDTAAVARAISMLTQCAQMRALTEVDPS